MRLTGLHAVMQVKQWSHAHRIDFKKLQLPTGEAG